MPSPADSQSKSLSCTSCRQRKIKCDKTQPCSGCRRSNIDCVFPPNLRLPRGRQGGSRARNAELTDRINRLEGLVKRLGGKPTAAEDLSFATAVITDPHASRPVIDRHAQTTYASPTANEPTDIRENDPIVKADGSLYLSGDFWSSLSGEVDGLRQLLNETSDDEDDIGPDSSVSSTRNKSSPEPYFFFKNNIEKTPLQLLHPSCPQIAMLSDIFFSRVDPLLKILHRPTVKTSIIAAAKDLGRNAGGSGQESLMFAIYFAAVTALTAEECIQYFRRDKDSLLMQYKYGTETALANADFLNSMELVTLQAFVIFLSCLRSHSENRSAWTLTSLAVRIAHALDLHRVTASSMFPPFQAEMRRRLWFSICVLDLRDAEDRGSAPMIHENSFSTTLPCNINDEDISPDSQLPILDRVGYTDMTFVLISCEATRMARCWNPVLPFTKDGSRSAHVTDRKDRERIINTFNKHLEAKYLVHCDTSVPINWFTANIIRLMQLKTQLVQQYPLHTRQLASRAESCREDSLKTAVSLLELSEELLCNECAANWLWWSRTWTQWHPLAVVLAELCIQPYGPLADRGWAIVSVVFEKEGERVADSKKGTLWRPIRKLLEKAQAARAQNATLSMDIALPPSEMASQPLESSVIQPDHGQFKSFDLNEGLKNVGLESFAVGRYPLPQSQPTDPLGYVLGMSHLNVNQESITDTVHWENWIEFLQSSWNGQASTSLDWTIPI